MERRAATACHCMLSCATACYVLTHLRILDNGGTVHPPHGLLRYTQTSERNLSPHRVCAHCAYCERCACSRYLYAHMHNLGVYFFLARFLSLFLPSSPPARRDGSQRLVQIRARTALLASNALAVGVKYTHLHTFGVW
jgi:hypothetical protein